ncbi:MAG: hypothetical protein KA164_00575 [Rhodoferax sp.]|jgi:ubiquinone biosynthesis protein UbiJ|nr:hypothetical protein [Rhodoferax sp.]
MATTSPLHLVERLARQVLTRIPPPPWAVDEVQRRLVLLLNHVLMQEKAATERLARQKGRVVFFQWQPFSMCFVVTPAGLLDLAAPGAIPDLSLTLSDTYAADVAQALLRGDKPAVRIEGDVQLAAEVNWLADHVRWDLEEDLARVIGDAPAHTLGQIVRRMIDASRRFTGAGKSATGRSTGAAP